jgi:YVTN family beta-propeller protein
VRPFLSTYLLPLSIVACFVLSVNIRSEAQTVFASGAGITAYDASTGSTRNFNSGEGFLTVSPDGAHLYASTIFGLNVIDTATGQVIANIAAGIRPQDYAISPDGKRLYIANFGEQTLYIADAVTNTLIKSLPVPAPLRVAVSPDYSRIYVSTTSGGVLILDPATDTVKGAIPGTVSGSAFGPFFGGISFSVDSRRAYIAFSNGFWVVDAQTDTLLQDVTIPTAAGTIQQVVPTIDGTRLYAAADRTSPTQGPQAVYVLDALTFSVTNQIPVGECSPQIALSSDGTKLFVSDIDAAVLDVVDMVTNTITASIPIGGPGSISGVATIPPTAPMPQPTTGTITVDTNLSNASFTVTGPNSFSGVGSLQVTAAPGTYTVVYSPVAKELTPIPQTLVLSAGGKIQFSGVYTPVVFTIDNDFLAFSYPEATVGPPGPVSVLVNSNSRITYVVTATSDVADWLHIDAGAGIAPGSLKVFVNGGLPAGTYAGSITLTSEQATNSPLKINVSLSVGPNRWEKIAGPWAQSCDTSFRALAVDPINPVVLYLGNSSQSHPCGIFKSIDGGATWTATNAGFPRLLPVSRIAVATSDNMIVYAATAEDHALFTSGQVFVSNNAGKDWKTADGIRIGLLKTFQINSPVVDLAISPADERGALVSLAGNGISRTINRGSRWSLVAEAPNPGAAYSSVRYAPSDSTIAYATGYSSTTGDLPICVFNFAAVIPTPDCLSFGVLQGLPPLRSTDGGKTWKQVTFPDPFSIVTDLQVSPRSAQTIYASLGSGLELAAGFAVLTSQSGVFKSLDGGNSWNPINGSGFTDMSQHAPVRLTVHSTISGHLFVMTPLDAFRSIDDGAHWLAMNTDGLQLGTFFYDIAIAEGKGEIYALTSTGAYKMKITE